MSNIAPQIHTAFNGSGGLWFKLERWIQDTLVKKQGRTVWVYAGSIIDGDPLEKVGPNQDIWVPTHFYKIIVDSGASEDNPKVLAFIFANESDRGDIFSKLVSINKVEEKANTQFFENFFDEKIESIGSEKCLKIFNMSLIIK